eukprot:15482310-Alexandrium_andersonii.AAC.1
MPTSTMHISLGASLRTALPRLSAFPLRGSVVRRPRRLAGAFLVRRPERPEHYRRCPLGAALA